MEEKKKKNWLFPTLITLVILGMISIFLFCYHSPITLNDTNRNFILNELRNDSTLDSVMVNTILVNPHVGSLVERKNGNVVSNETMQNISFVTKTDTSTTKYEGCLILEPKFFGYDIIEVRVNK